jgi:SAM-dependent methyltransferase
MAADKPYSPACDRNREPILAVLRDIFADRRRVLEIGSGTGQHAVHFAAAMPHLVWQATDRAANLPGIRMWLDEARLPNTPSPLVLDVNGAWPTDDAATPRFDAVFTANTLHIMGWDDVVRLFARLPSAVEPDATLAIYGPFRYGGRHTSDSNEAFDARLRAEDARQGIRDAEAVEALARDAGFDLVADHAMPANNRTLVFGRPTAQRSRAGAAPTNGR